MTGYPDIPCKGSFSVGPEYGNGQGLLPVGPVYGTMVTAGLFFIGFTNVNNNGVIPDNFSHVSDGWKICD